MAAHVKTANLPKQTVTKYPQSDRRKGPYPFKGGPGLEGLGKFRQPSMFDSLSQFAASPLGIGTGLGLGGLGALAYMNSRSRKDKDEEKEAFDGVSLPGAPGKENNLLSDLKAFGDSMTQENGPLQGAARSVGNTIGGIFNPQGADPNYIAAARLGLQALLGSPDAKYPAPAPTPAAPAPAPAPAPVANPGLFNSLKQFATSPLGIAGLGLGTLGTGMYLGSQGFSKNDDEDEKKAGVKLLAKVAAKNRIKQAELDFSTQATDKFAGIKLLVIR